MGKLAVVLAVRGGGGDAGSPQIEETLDRQEPPPRAAPKKGAGSPQPSPPANDGEEAASGDEVDRNPEPTSDQSLSDGAKTESSSFFQRTAQKASDTWRHYAGGEPASDLPSDSKQQNEPLSHLSLSGARALAATVFKNFPIWFWSSFLVHPSEQGGGPTLAGMYAAALLGASCGFWLFLYFISLGYAAGIGIPSSIALTHFVRSTAAATSSTAKTVFSAMDTWQRRTVLHTSLVILWSLRMFVFLFWREYFNWPNLHARIVQVNQKPRAVTTTPDSTNSTTSVETTASQQAQQPQQGPPSLLVKLLCWLVYSFFYLCMLSPSFFRLRHGLAVAASQEAMTATRKLSLYQPAVEVAENVALAMQSVGLLLESVADWQKSNFKAKLNCRYEWCGLSAGKGLNLWRWSTHPNYLGEGLFWLGTFLGGLVSLLQNFSFDKDPLTKFLWQLGFMVLGFGFICRVLQGAVESLDDKQDQKYGHLPEFVAFRHAHGLLGPKWFTKKEVLSETTSLASDTVANATIPEQGGEVGDENKT